MLGFAALFAGFFVAVVKQAVILGPQDAAVGEFFAENDFRNAAHHADPRIVHPVFTGKGIDPTSIPILAADAPSIRLGVAVLKQIREGLIVVVLVDPVAVEGKVGGIQNSNERDVVDQMVGAMPVLAIEHRHPVANEAFSGLPRHDRDQMTAHAQKRGGLFVQFDGKHGLLANSNVSSIKAVAEWL